MIQPGEIPCVYVAPGHKLPCNRVESSPVHDGPGFDHKYVPPACPACAAIGITGTDGSNYIHTMANPVGSEKVLHNLVNELLGIQRRKDGEIAQYRTGLYQIETSKCPVGCDMLATVGLMRGFKKSAVSDALYRLRLAEEKRRAGGRT